MQISFEAIANLFWKMHNPCATKFSRQYMSAIWYHNQQQREILESISVTVEQERETVVTTPIAVIDKFYLAEDYHQKYRLQNRQHLMNRFKEFYPEFDDFNNSTSAARINGIIGGAGNRALLEEEGSTYGFELDELMRLI